MFCFARIAGAAFIVLNFLWFTTVANADAGVRVRLMLHPYVAAPGELPPSALADTPSVVPTAYNRPAIGSTLLKAS